MAQVESRLWWYRALHHLAVHAISTHPLGRAARIVDAGCGTGGLLMFLRERGFQKLSGFDLSPEAVAICEERELPVQMGDLRFANQILGATSSDVIISNDTLYFFNSEEQKKILAGLAHALAPNGLLIVNVPALRAFRGIHDVSVGIAHRFAKSEVQKCFASTGLSLVGIRYWPFLLSPLIYLTRLRQRVRLQNNPEIEARSDVALPPPSINRALEMVTRLENAILPCKPFGSSLFAVARKPS